MVATTMKQFKFFLVNLFLLFFMSITPAFAGFGVSPAEIYNSNLKPGAKFEKNIVLSRSDADEDLKVSIETDLGESESWFKFDPGKEFIFPKGESRKEINITISVPENVEIRNYNGVLRIKASSIDAASSGVSIVKGARMEVNLVTTNLNVDVLNVKNMEIADINSGDPIKLLLDIENNGNTDISPTKIIIEFQDLNQSPVDTQEVTKIDKIPSNKTKKISVDFKNNLSGGGEFFAVVKVYLNETLLRSDRLVFKINSSSLNSKSSISLANSSNFLSKLFDLIKNNQIETLFILMIPLLPVIIGFILYKKTKLVSIKTLFFVLTIVYTIFALFLINRYHQYRLSTLAQPGDIGSVQGESTDVPPTNIPKAIPQSNLIINQDITKYPVYRLPDTSSPIVYMANDGEKFDVIKETEIWYNVSIDAHTNGWIPKTSIKQTQ